MSDQKFDSALTAAGQINLAVDRLVKFQLCVLIGLHKHSSHMTSFSLSSFASKFWIIIMSQENTHDSVSILLNSKFKILYFIVIVWSLWRRMLCKAYEVGWDFVIAPEQQQQAQWRSPPHIYAASLTDEDSSCYLYNLQLGFPQSLWTDQIITIYCEVCILSFCVCVGYLAVWRYNLTVTSFNLPRSQVE